MIKTVTVNGRSHSIIIAAIFENIRGSNVFRVFQGWECELSTDKPNSNRYIGAYSTVSNVVRAFKNQKRTEDEIVCMAHFIVKVGGGLCLC